MNTPRLIIVSVFAMTVIAVLLMIFLAVEKWSSGLLPQSAHEEQSRAILAELKTIRQLLESQVPRVGEAPARPRPAPAMLKVSVEDSPSLGNPQAPLTMVEFTDFQCPYCNRFHQQTFPLIKKEFIDKGNLRYMVRDLPLDFHEQAIKAAQAAHCAGEQGKYWAMKDALFRNAKALGAENLPGYAEKTGVDLAKFQECFSSRRYLEQIQASVADAKRLGISGTPTFVIGRNIGNDRIEGHMVVGAHPYAAFEKAIMSAGKNRN